MRGKRGCVLFPLGFGRNIPAYAGKTEPTEAKPSENSEHPRVCGENGHHLAMLIGSSRNIPAYAGKTYHYRMPST